MAHIIAQIVLSYDEYFDFASSFLEAGYRAQELLSVDLGIHISKKDEEEA